MPKFDEKVQSSFFSIKKSRYFDCQRNTTTLGLLESRKAAACKRSWVVQNCVMVLAASGRGRWGWMNGTRQEDQHLWRQMPQSHRELFPGENSVGNKNLNSEVKPCLVTGCQGRNTGLMCCKYSESHHWGSPLHTDPFPLRCESMLAVQHKKQLMVQKPPVTSCRQHWQQPQQQLLLQGTKRTTTGTYSTLLQGIWPKPAHSSLMVTICTAGSSWPCSGRKVKYQQDRVRLSKSRWKEIWPQALLTFSAWTFMILSLHVPSVYVCTCYCLKPA